MTKKPSDQYRDAQPATQQTRYQNNEKIDYEGTGNANIE